MTAACVVTLALGLTAIASAHSLYVSSSPAANSTVSAAPSVVKGFFDSGINPKGSSLTVTGATGRADLGDGHVDLNDPNRQTMVVSLKPGFDRPIHRELGDQLAADDGDAANGTWTFTVAARAASSPAQATASAPAALPRSGGVPGEALIAMAGVLTLAGFGLRRGTGSDHHDGRAR